MGRLSGSFSLLAISAAALGWGLSCTQSGLKEVKKVMGADRSLTQSYFPLFPNFLGAGLHLGLFHLFLSWALISFNLILDFILLPLLVIKSKNVSLHEFPKGWHSESRNLGWACNLEVVFFMVVLGFSGELWDVLIYTSGYTALKTIVGESRV